MGHVISITDEQAQFVELETFKRIQYDIDESWIDIFELSNLGAVLDHIFL